MKYKSIVFGIALFWVVGTSAFYDMGSGNGPVVPNPAPSPTQTVGEELLGATEFWKLTSGNLNPVVGSWGLAVPGLSGVGPGTECVQVSATGVFSATGSACGAGGGGGSSFLGLDFGVIGGTDVKISSIQFDAGGFNVSNTASQGFVRIDYTNGPASRSMANTWTEEQTFSQGIIVADTEHVTWTGSGGIFAGGTLTLNATDLAIELGGALSINTLTNCDALNTDGAGVVGCDTSGPWLPLNGGTLTGNLIGTGASFSAGEFTAYASASKLYGAGLTGCTGTTFLQWTGGLFGCGTPAGGGSSNFTGLDFGTIGGAQVKISSISFDAGMFDLSNTASEGYVRLDWTNGPASRSMANTWSAVNTFSAGASVSSRLEVAGTASISGQVTINNGAGTFAGASVTARAIHAIGTGSTKGVELGNISADRPAIAPGSAAYLGIISGTTGILFYNNGANTFNGMWSNAGNLRIGDANSPTARLEVSNGSTAQSIFQAQDNGTAVFTITDGGQVQVSNSTAPNLLVSGAGAGGVGSQFGSLRLGNSAGSYTTLDNNYDTGIFSTTNSWSAGTFSWLLGASEKMRINSTGVGIGTTAPDKALEINSATGANLRLTYNDSNGSAANYSDFTVGSTGGLTITSAGTNPKTLVVNNGSSTGNILEAQDNGTAVFTVADGGNVTSTAQYIAPINAVGYSFSGVPTYGIQYSSGLGGVLLMTAGNAYAGATVTNGFEVSTDGVTFKSSTVTAGTADIFLTREAAATLQMGRDVNGAAVNQTFKAHDGITGTDIAGANLTIAGGRGTGAGLPGLLQFQTATQLTTGTTAQTLSRIGSASQAGWEFSGFASASQTFSSGLTSCTGSNALQWSAGLFSCAAVSGGSGVASGSLDWDEFKQDMTLDKNHSIASGSGAWSLPIRATIKEWDGTAASPSFSFANDSNTGLYRRGADILGFTAGGTAIASASAGGWEFAGYASASRMYTGPGTGALPAYSFGGDKDTGFWNSSSNTIAISTGGSLKWTINDDGSSGSIITANSTDNRWIRVGNGTAAIPSYGFFGDTDTGMYLTAINSGTIAFSSGGVRIGSASTSGWEFGGTASVSSRFYLPGLTAASGTPNSICQNGSEVTVNAALTCTVSSRDFKTSIDDFFGSNAPDGILGSSHGVSALDLIMKLQPRQFAYKDQPSRLRWGFIAEEVSEVDPKLGDAIQPDGHAMSIDIAGLIALNTKAIQEQQEQIDALSGDRPLGASGQSIAEQIDSLSVWQLMKLIVIKVFNLN